MDESDPAPPPGGLAGLVPEPVRRAWRLTAPAHGLVMVGAGTLWDWLTLGRVDDTSTIGVLFLYLLVFAGLVAVEARIRAGQPMPAWLVRQVNWVALVGQFFLGSLLSAWLILFLRSSSPTAGWGFLSLLAAALLITELLGEHVRREWLQVGLLYFCAYAFSLFAIPVLTGTMGWWVNVGAAVGAAALAIPVVLVAAVPVFGEGPRRWGALVAHAGVWAGLLFGLTLGAWLNLIPPVPLAAQHVGVYHDVQRTSEGYVLTFQRQPFPYLLWRRQDVDFWRGPNDVVHVFSAIYAPGGLAFDVVHVWERKNPEKWLFVWEEQDRLTYAMKGGRDGGFRGWTKKRSVKAGEWRVRVLTPAGRELGRVYFEVHDEAANAQTLWTRTW